MFGNFVESNGFRRLIRFSVLRHSEFYARPTVGTWDFPQSERFQNRSDPKERGEGAPRNDGKRSVEVPRNVPVRTSGFRGLARCRRENTWLVRPGTTKG